MAKMARGPLFPLCRLPSEHADLPLATVGPLRSGHRSGHAPSRGRGPSSASGPLFPTTIGSSAPCRPQPADRSSEASSILRPARQPAPLASRTGSTQVDLPEGHRSSEGPRRDRSGSGAPGQGGGSAGSFPSWVSAWHLRASGTSSSVTASTRPRTESGPPGMSS